MDIESRLKVLRALDNTGFFEALEMHLSGTLFISAGGRDVAVVRVKHEDDYTIKDVMRLVDRIILLGGEDVIIYYLAKCTRHEYQG